MEKCFMGKKGLSKNDTNIFLFSLNKNRKYYKKNKDCMAIYCYKTYGPWRYWLC